MYVLDMEKKLKMILKIYVFKDYVNEVWELNCSGNTGTDSF